MPATETQGTQLLRGQGDGPPETFNIVGQFISFDGPGGAASVIDVTHLQSLAKEKLMGLRDEGQFTAELNLDAADTEQLGLKDDRANRTLRNFRIILNDTGNTQLNFAGYVLNFSISGGVDDKVALSITIEITGEVVWT